MVFVLEPRGSVEDAVAAGGFFWLVCRACAALDRLELGPCAAAHPRHRDMPGLVGALRPTLTCRRCGASDCELDYRGPDAVRVWAGDGPAPPAPPFDPARAPRPPLRAAARADSARSVALVSRFFESFRPLPPPREPGSG